VSVCVVFVSLRPLNSPWHPFIAGDGLGYYAYLPAKFIHGDPNYDFKWFNRVYNANYVYSTFENPEDNLLVKYGDKKINKYYQGLSYVWMPFFFAGHICAKLFHYPADGFSKPYQLFIGLASVFYLLLGLIFLHKLLLNLFRNELAALLSTIAVFYGTHLFNYAIFANSLSHSYSFSFNVLFLYFVQCYFNSPENKTRNFLLCFLCLTLTASIRPLNGLILLTVPAFIPGGFRPGKFSFKHIGLLHLVLLALVIGAIFHQLSISYKQTGSLIPYTYANERFYFERNKFIEALFSYHIGLFIYVPLVVVALPGIFFMRRKQAFVLALFFFGVLFLYSCWWYWPITKRAMIDYYALPAIWLAAGISSHKRFSTLFVWIILVLLSVVYYQFKEMQMRRGVLSEFSTYKELFWENFFRLEKTSNYLIPPSTIIASEEHREDFESAAFKAPRTKEQAFSGQYSLLVDKANYICTFAEYPFPALFSKSEIKKVRFSFRCFFEEGITVTHAFIQFFNKEHQSVVDVPFYLNKEDVYPGRWDLKEFGYEITDTTQINARTVDRIGFTIWNVEAKKKLFVDDVKIEFLLTDRSFETIPN
jgi:hypothetical protein